MTIPFSCPFCGHRTEVDEQYLGQSGPCLACGNTIRVAAPMDNRQAMPAASLTGTSRPLRRPWVAMGTALGAVAALIGFAVLVAMPLVTTVQQASHAQRCQKNLQQIAQALQQYHKVYGTFPPAVVSDAAGSPMLSWRVMILPYLGVQAARLYDEYKLDEPFDSPHNRTLSHRMPGVYACPADSGAAPNETSYLALVGPQTAFDQQPVRLAQITDDRTTTLLIIESSSSSVDWLQPIDFPLSRAGEGLNSGNLTSPGSGHPGVVFALAADGQVLMLDETLVTAAELKALTTIAGGEFIDPDEYAVHE